jgi:DnaJ-class molecular chaperone
MNALRKQIMTARHSFELLSVHAQNTAEQLHEARRRLAMQLHPDLCDSSDATDLMARVNVALRNLTVDRARYMATLGGRQCPTCEGRGVSVRQVTFTRTREATCATCAGSGRQLKGESK